MKSIVIVNYLMYIKLFVLLLVHFVDGIDPDRELVYDGTIFAIFSASADAFDQLTAVDNCISWGGNIASINSQEEDAQFFSLTNSTHFQCWIGLNRHQNSILSRVNPDGYVWEDGSDGTYRKFIPNISSLQYAKFRANNGYSLSEEWIDANADDNTTCYLCRKIANSRGCDITNNGSCYRTYQVDPWVNWYAAQSSCEDWGGDLASVTSEAENMLLFTRTPIIAFDCWIGMYYTSVNGNITWNDGNAFSYDRWNIGQSTLHTNCINWNSEGRNIWVNANCINLNLKCYICKRIQTIASIPEVKDETLYGDSVFGYFYASWPGVSWNTALQECVGWGGSLASIESAAEDGTLYSLAAGNDTQCWIGLEVSTRGSESIVWVDGSDGSYRNYPGQTPTITAIDKYYSLRAMNGRSGGGWNALNMAETLSCFYCQKLANQRGCNLTYDGSCYRTFETNTALNWNDSQSNCMSWGGNLASITSQQENDFLFLRTPYSATNCWIGLTDVNNDGIFQWIDGEQFTYDNWAGGTANSDPTADCAQSKIDGIDGWENLKCSNLTKCYICKRYLNIARNPRLEREITFNGSIFSYYTSHRAGLFVGTAQLFYCIHTGGNLATIGSAELDQLLYDSAVSDDVECWIGLEKRTRGNETSIWADGSVSSYRNYPGQTPINDQITEYYSLRARSGNRTSGWEGKNRHEALSCFICQRPVTDRECQFTNDGFCYRAFQLVYPTINWNAAQLSCIGWGSNLASITSEAENTLLYYRTPYSAEDCWIGLTERNVGRYYWIDGEHFSYNQSHGLPPSNEASVDYCGRNKFEGLNSWSLTDCNATAKCYICKRDLNARNYSDKVIDFAVSVNYIIGSPALLYYSDASVADILIRWTAERVKSGDVALYNPEYRNPVPLSAVFSNTGAGQHMFTCFYRNSPATVLGSVEVNLKDTATVTVIYSGFEKTFSDVNNPYFPNPQQIGVPLNTANFILTCNSSDCIWNILYPNNTEKKTKPFVLLSIPIFHKEDEGIYSLHVASNSGKEYNTASIAIKGIETMVDRSSNVNTVTIALITVIAVIVGIVSTSIGLGIFFLLWWKKKNTFHLKAAKRSQMMTNNNADIAGYTNLEELYNAPREYINISNSTLKREETYATIAETPLILPETDEIKVTNVHDSIDLSPYYSNLGRSEDSDRKTKPTMHADVEKREEKQSQDEIKPIPISSTTQARSTLIPAKEFSKKYKIYIKNENGSIISDEFEKLNTECRQEVRKTFAEGGSVENFEKNFSPSLLPYGENRVILNSANSNCNYINASWLDNHQFIATAHPTCNTSVDFLQMVYQTKASMIVMLTTEKEKANIIEGISDRVCYWPKPDGEFKCEHFEMRLTESTGAAAFVKNELSLKNTFETKEHSFVQCISSIWNEDGTVFEMNFVDSLLSRIMKQKQSAPTIPIIIHCADGISKTGVIMTVYNAILEMNVTSSTSIFNNVKNLRRQRMQIVPTLACYTTCYSLMNEYCSIHL